MNEFSLDNELLRIASLIKRGERLSAFESLLGVYSSSHDDYDALKRIALLFEQIDRHGVALEIREYLSKRLPHDIAILISAAESRCHLARTSLDFFSIERELDLLVRKYDLDSDQRFAISLLFQKCRSLNKALEVLRGAADKDAKSYRYLFRLSYLYFFSDSKRKAIKQLRKILSLSALTSSQLHESGVLATKCGNISLDMLFAQRQYKEFPKDPNAVEHLASAFISEGSYDQARDLILPFVAQMEQYRIPVVTIVKLANVLCALSEREIERTFLTIALKQHPKDESILRVFEAAQLVQTLPTTS